MKNKLFESFMKTSDTSTDPFSAIVEGPTFTFGDKGASKPEEDPEGLGRAENGAHSTKTDTDYERRKMQGLLNGGDINTFNDLDVSEPEYNPYGIGDPSDLEKAGTEILKRNYYDDEGRPYKETGNQAFDAMADAIPLEGEVSDFDDEIVPEESPLNDRGEPIEDEFVDSETVLGADEEPVEDDETSELASDSETIAVAETLSNISTEELLKELEFRLKNKD